MIEGEMAVSTDRLIGEAVATTVVDALLSS
jgi:hypothetical protein